MLRREFGFSPPATPVYLGYCSLVYCQLLFLILLYIIQGMAGVTAFTPSTVWLLSNLGLCRQSLCAIIFHQRDKVEQTFRFWRCRNCTSTLKRCSMEIQILSKRVAEAIFYATHLIWSESLHSLRQMTSCLTGWESYRGLTKEHNL